MQKYTLQQNSWASWEPVDIYLPDEWEVEYHGMKGDELPAMTKEQIIERINQPYGCATLSEMAKGAQKVAIVFDDITRGTPTPILAQATLDILHAAGIQRDQIRFICALGMHGAHTTDQFAAKLGEDIVKQYEVFNHNPYENCVEIGTTSDGTIVKINKEFFGCDLKIGIGAITPHIFNVYGGGGKILFPGIADADTIHKNHVTGTKFLIENKLNIVSNMGKLEVDGMRKEIEEMVKMVGPFFKIDCIYNSKLVPIKVYAGDPQIEYYEGVKDAQYLYATPFPKDKDIVIVNANSRANEAAIAMAIAMLGITHDRGGEIVLVNFTKMGQMTHYLFGGFGTETGGRLWGKLSTGPGQLKKLIYHSSTYGYSDLGWFRSREKTVFAPTWDDVLKELSHRGAGTKVSVICDGTIVYCSDEFAEKAKTWS